MVKMKKKSCAQYAFTGTFLTMIMAYGAYNA